MEPQYGYVTNKKGRKIHYEYIRACDDGHPAPCILIGHGYDGHKDRPYVQTIKNVARDLNCSSLAFDLTGCGRSEGKLSDLTPKAAVQDWEAIIAKSNELPGIHPKRRAAFGTSFSANALAQYAAQDDAEDMQALILHVPVPKPKKIVNFLLQLQVLLQGRDLDKMPPEDVVRVAFGDLELHVTSAFGKQMREMNLYKEAAPRINVPTTIIGGENDALVAPSKLKKLRDAFPEKTDVTLEIVKKAGHSFNAKQLDKLAAISSDAIVRAFPALGVV